MKISKDSFYATFAVIVLYIVVFASVFLPMEIKSPLMVLLGVLVMIMTFGRIKRRYLVLVLPLIVVLVIGSFGVWGHESRDILRDISFALAPISLILVGFWAADSAEDGRQSILRALVMCGVILAGAHLIVLLQNPELMNVKLYDLREETIWITNNLVPLSLILGLLQYRLRVGNLFPWFLPRFIALPILSASFILSYSRIELGVALIFLLSLLGFVGRIRLRTLAVMFVVVATFFAFIVTTPKDDVTTFRGKIARSFTELTISDYSTSRDINNNWRGYETYRALVTFSSGNILQQIFGHGFGALVNLGILMNLAGQEYYDIPRLHNGYAYILVKTGVLGLACYLFFYISIISHAVRYHDSADRDLRSMARLTLGLILGLAFVMFLAGGIAEGNDSVLIFLLGYLMRRLSRPQTKKIISLEVTSRLIRSMDSSVDSSLS